MNTTAKNVLLWMVILVVILLLFQVLNWGKAAPPVGFTDFMEMVGRGEVDRVTIRGQEIRAWKKGVPETQPGIRTYAPSYDDLVPELRKANVKITAEEPREGSFLVMALQWAPILFLIGLWIFIMRQMQSGGNRALAFGKSRARLLTPSQKKVTFKDVAGCDEAKEELTEIIEFLKDPSKFQKLGGKIPKGVLMMGPPGTGKTLLARAVAGEANVPFFSISGSDFVEMFVGVGASRVRDLFEQGKKNAPCIIFIDEIDAVGRHRGAGLGGGHDEREQTLNALLVEMDGFEGNDGVILMAATNRPDVLDPALLRPGRFDRRVVVDRPDVKGREGILKVHTKNIPLSDDVDLSVVARGTPGFAGADLANLVNEAALGAARQDKKKVEQVDFDYAKDKVLMGAERRSMVMSEEERRNTAYHEAGHALIAAFEEHADPLHKVTIIPRGRALGVTQQLPLEDKYSYSKEYVEARLAVMMGGRLAEEICLGQVTTGASNDFGQATEMARRMVCEWGMSELGPLSFGRDEGEIFLGRDFARRPDYSEDTARKIDAEVNRIVQAAYARGRKILLEHRESLEVVAKELLERESLDGEEIYAILTRITGKEPAGRHRKAAHPPAPPAAPAAASPKDEGESSAPSGLLPQPA
ncbi:MAG: ATP-dependent metallopeptidase FtsH/Yme1/Tma family protein [Acidobacteria bacterium]|nr:MAG: ATP-dependent metallopeptidase FtsH/Yme1/Tma family protein [Acidobacteriota bacterium]MCE7959923.1 ATP-dependent metallopeptidase FtsH/Yme1/Tma family protein [Acidobacteria bacterium ACB2]